jgi:hypothetical protein
MYNMAVIVGKASPKVSMISRGSPKFGRMLTTTSSSMKKVSPQSRLAKTAGSPKGMIFIVYS